MIRHQQTQIQQLQTTHSQPSTSAVDDTTTPTSERSMSIPQSSSTPQPTVSPLPNSAQGRPHSPFPYTSRRTISRQSSMADRSRGNSHTGSPALPPSSAHPPYESHEYLPGPAVHARDEGLFYQAETQMLTRENQMLKQRIRELGESSIPGKYISMTHQANSRTERQLSDLNPTSPAMHSSVNTKHQRVRKAPEPLPQTLPPNLIVSISLLCSKHSAPAFKAWIRAFRAMQMLFPSVSLGEPTVAYPGWSKPTLCIPTLRLYKKNPKLHSIQVNPNTQPNRCSIRILPASCMPRL
jgi:hypothetical protein